MSIKEFLADKKLVLEYEDQLSIEAFFIAGISAVRSQHKLGEILELLKQTQEEFDNDLLSKANKAIIELHLYQGKVEEAAGILKNHQAKQNKLQEPQPEINRKLEIPQKPVENKPLMETKGNTEGSSVAANPQKGAKIISDAIQKPLKAAQTPNKPRKQKLSNEDLRKCEMTVMDILNTLRRVDEKEALAQRKLEEQKRLEAEIAAKDLKVRLEKEYQEKLKFELEEQRRKEEQTVKCVFCKDKIPDKDLYLLENCAHAFHKKCLKETVQKDMDDKKIPICCSACKSELTIIEIKSQLTKRQAQMYEDLLFKAFMHAEDSEFSCCPSPGCSFMFEYEENLKTLDCPTCKRKWCLECRRNGHPGFDCNQMFGFGGAFGGRAVNGMERGQKFKACMMCGVWVEKQDGIRLTCTCGTRFCYTCGSYQGCKCA